MLIQPYLFFEGRCEEALEFYKTALGAQVQMMMRYSENPEPQGGADCPSMPGDKIMHASFTVGSNVLMASDGMASGKTEFKGISLSLSVTTEAEAEKVFAALGDGGQVQMPLTKTFYSPSFGMVADRFGVSWMVIVPGDMPPQ
ncbi:MAG: VOC family protein [Pseudomonadota bacterium]